MPSDEWIRLGKLLIAARVDADYPRRATFIREKKLTAGQARTIEDLENGRRDNYDPSTLAFVERLYGWATGSIEEVLHGGTPRLRANPLSVAPIAEGAPARQGGGGHRSLSEFSLAELADEIRRRADESP